jgi:hypothetical protein
MQTKYARTWMDNYAKMVKPEINHRPSAKDSVSAIGLRWKRLDEKWAIQAARLQRAIADNPEDSELYIKAIELGVQVFVNNPIRIPHNHTNGHNYDAFVLDTVKTVFNQKPRMFSVASWEGLFAEDDRSADDKLDFSKLYGGTFTPYAIELWGKSQDGIIDMLCTIQLLTKLLQK